MRRLWLALFVAYAAATAVHVGFCVAREPFSFDAWNVAFDTRGEPFSLGNLVRYWGYEYTHSNPRIGQPVAYCAYKLSGFAEIATPLVFLALSLAVTVLALGRWPWRRGGDLALWAVAIGCAWFLPELGRNMFSRAYATNYVYTAALQLWFLVPLRIARQDCSTRTAIAYGALGVLAGACNEHTGPALLALVGGYAWWRRRRGEPARLAWAGAVGFAIGFAIIFFAPGQGERYDGLATKTGLATRLLQRGFITNVNIIGDYLRFAAPLLALALIVLLARAADEDARKRALRWIGLALAFGGVVAVTLFVSPRLGSRFFIVPVALLIAGVLALVAAIPQRLPLLVFAVTCSIYAAARTVPLYARVARESAARMALLEATAPGGAVVADAFAQVEESWWFIGDDFRTAHQRTAVARYLGLQRIGFRGWDPDAPLGASGVQIVAPGALDLTGVKPMDVAGIQAAIRTQLADGEVTVVADGVQLPRPRLVLARWRDGRWEAHAGAIARPGVSIEREVTLPPELRGREIYVVQIGSETRRLGATLRYTPWRTGVYWVLACDAAECWLVAAGRNHAA